MEENIKVIKVKEIKFPPNYNQLKSRLTTLEKENELLKSIISEGNFSTLENMVTNFKIQMIERSKKITFEFNTCKYSKKNRALILNLTETMEDLTRQFKDLLS